MKYKKVYVKDVLEAFIKSSLSTEYSYRHRKNFEILAEFLRTLNPNSVLELIGE